MKKLCYAWKKHSFITMALCALATLAAFGIYHMIQAAQWNSGCETKKLMLADFVPVDAEIIDETTMINASDDTQLIYTSEGFIRNIYIDCSFSANPGEFIAFYNSDGSSSWSETRKEWAERDGDTWYFEFPSGTRQIRIDTGVEPSITVTFHDIEMNRPTAYAQNGWKNAELIYMLIAPVLLWTALDTVIGLFVGSGKEEKDEEV